MIIAPAQLLSNDIDPDGDLLKITGVNATSSNGGSVTLINDMITYSPPPVAGERDVIMYTVSDSSGASAVGAAILQLAGSPKMEIFRPENGASWQIRVVGPGNRRFIIEASTDGAKWEAYREGLSDATGAGEIELVGMSDRGKLYRTFWP
jgi:hypothetical protein